LLLGRTRRLSTKKNGSLEEKTSLMKSLQHVGLLGRNRSVINLTFLKDDATSGRREGRHSSRRVALGGRSLCPYGNQRLRRYPTRGGAEPLLFHKEGGRRSGRKRGGGVLSERAAITLFGGVRKGSPIILEERKRLKTTIGGDDVIFFTWEKKTGEVRVF